MVEEVELLLATSQSRQLTSVWSAGLLAQLIDHLSLSLVQCSLAVAKARRGYQYSSSYCAKAAQGRSSAHGGEHRQVAGAAIAALICRSAMNPSG